MKIGFGAVVAALVATVAFAQAPASAMTLSAKPAVAAATSAVAPVTFRKGVKKRSAHRAHKRHKHAHAHRAHKHGHVHKRSHKKH